MGFRQMFVSGADALREYGSFSVWESQEDAAAANVVIAPQVQQALTGLLQGPPSRWLVEVLEAMAKGPNKYVRRRGNWCCIYW